MSRQVFPITPVPAPRMTRRDRWRERPCVRDYFAFRDAVADSGMKLPEVPCKVTFYLPMPGNWSDAKRGRFDGAPHMQKPDIDNLLKALLDAVFRNRDDSHIWSIWPEKRWGRQGCIAVEAL